jgi:hypothetical protein
VFKLSNYDYWRLQQKNLLTKQFDHQHYEHLWRNTISNSYFQKKKKNTTINDTQIDDIWTNTSTQTVSFWIQIRVRVRVLWIFLINQSTTLQQCFPFVLCLWSAPQCFALRARFLLPFLFFLGSPALSVFVLSVYRRRLLFPHHHSLSCVVVVVVVVFDIAFFFFFSVY